MALSPVDALVIQLIDAIRTQVLSELKGMSLNDLLRVAGGGNGAAAGTSTSPAAKRGPGRPKKVATAPAPSKKASSKSGKRVRRTIDDIKRVASKVGALLGDHPEGLSSEAIQKTLGIAKSELTGPIAFALNEGTISKTGEKRGTKYHAKADGARGKKKG